MAGESEALALARSILRQRKLDAEKVKRTVLEAEEEALKQVEEAEKLVRSLGGRLDEDAEAPLQTPLPPGYERWKGGGNLKPLTQLKKAEGSQRGSRGAQENVRGESDVWRGAKPFPCVLYIGYSRRADFMENEQLERECNIAADGKGHVVGLILRHSNGSPFQKVELSSPDAAEAARIHLRHVLPRSVSVQYSRTRMEPSNYHPQSQEPGRRPHYREDRAAGPRSPPAEDDKSQVERRQREGAQDDSGRPNKRRRKERGETPADAQPAEVPGRSFEDERNGREEAFRARRGRSADQAGPSGSDADRGGARGKQKVEQGGGPAGHGFPAEEIEVTTEGREVSETQAAREARRRESFAGEGQQARAEPRAREVRVTPPRQAATQRQPAGQRQPAVQRGTARVSGTNLVSQVWKKATVPVPAGTPLGVVVPTVQRKIRDIQHSKLDNGTFLVNQENCKLSTWTASHDGRTVQEGRGVDVANRAGKFVESFCPFDAHRVATVYMPQRGELAEQVGLVDMQTGRLDFARDTPHVRGAYCVATLPGTPSAARLVTGGLGHEVVAWVVDERGVRVAFRPRLLHAVHTSSVNHLEVLRHQPWVLSAGLDGRAVSYDLRHQTPVELLKKRPKLPLYRIIQNPVDPNLLLFQVGNVGLQYELRDLRTPEQPLSCFGWIPKATASQGPTTKATWSPGGMLIASGSTDAEVHLFDIRKRNNKPLVSLPTSSKAKKSLWFRGGSVLVTSVADRNSLYLSKLNCVFT